MTRQALAQDRGLQPERTALAWTRTALAGLTSGAVVLLRDRDLASLLHNPWRLLVGGVAMTVAADTFGLGLRRRRDLATKPAGSSGPARRDITTIGVAVIVLSVLVVTYLLIARR